MIEEDFNSQPHKEADSVSIKPCAHFVRFQLTASQGGWLIKSVIAVSNTYFNSQPHKEADQVFHSFCFLLSYFNSQPHKEADRNQCIDEITGEVFQLTASQGGWHDTISPYFRHDAFQLTASQGGWRSKQNHRNSLDHFNSQPHKEADPALDLRVSASMYFNSQPHKEADIKPTEGE